MLSREAQMDITISDYFKLKAHCTQPSKITTANHKIIDKKTAEPGSLHEKVLDGDTQVEAWIEVCNIQAHNMVWFRDDSFGPIIKAMQPLRTAKEIKEQGLNPPQPLKEVSFQQ